MYPGNCGYPKRDGALTAWEGSVQGACLDSDPLTREIEIASKACPYLVAFHEVAFDGKLGMALLGLQCRVN